LSISTPPNTKKPLSLPILLCLLSCLLLTVATGCRQNLLEPPRLATHTAQAIAAKPTEPGLILANLPTPTLESEEPQESFNTASTSFSDTVTFWVNETSEQHAEALYSLVDSFTEASNVRIELVMISSNLLPELVSTAVVSRTLPDLVLHPVEFSPGWADRGILDIEATSEIISELGEGTFDQTALQMVAADSGASKYYAVPINSLNMAIIYRRDWFSELGLKPPDSYDNLLVAAETLFDPEQKISGFVVSTDPAAISTQQIFEFIAAANGCELINSQGEISLIHPACLNALDFYRHLISSYSPIGMQTDASAINAYLAGRTGIIIASPEVVPAIAGLVEGSVPSCYACVGADYLAENSGFIVNFIGSGENARQISFQSVTGLGITTEANKHFAQMFANYWFENGYLDWLAVRPERKMPARLGNDISSTLYIDSWKNLPLDGIGLTLADLYSDLHIETLISSGDIVKRWGFSNDNGDLVSRLYEDKVFSSLLQEMLSGYFTSSQTILAMQDVATDFFTSSADP